MNIPIPEGFEIPDGLSPGDTFDVSATVRLGEDGLTLMALDGMALEAAEDAEMEADAAEGFVGAYTEAMK